MYPIRKSRSYWVYTFLKPHICDSLCNTKYEIQQNMFRITYSPGCLFPEQVEPVCVHISQYKEDILSFTDKLLTDLPKTINLVINYPLRVPITRECIFDINQDIYMSTILEKFDEMYKEIYETEEKESSIQEFEIKKRCNDCSEEKYSEENLLTFLNPVPESNIQCNICFEEEDIYELYFCKHKYHKKCILKWFNTTKITEESEEVKSNSCPLCRQPIIYCESCKGIKYITENYTGTVIPFGVNGEDRIETDGPYGIHTLYYEELLFKGFFYNKEKNELILLPYERLV